MRFRFGLIGLVLLAACDAGEPPLPGGPAVMRRLTEAQYRAIISDVFGPQIVVAGAFDPLPREDGLVALGAARASITASGFERFDALARSIATQVTGPANRDTLVGCGPADATAFDEACAQGFLAEAGRLLYRRPLDDAELAGKVAAARGAAALTQDFHVGLGQALAGMLVSPNFLYVSEGTEPDPSSQNGLRLDAYAKAQRLSFLLWNSAPDDALLDAAARGDLHNAKTLAQQVDRLMASPRLAEGVRAFFSDMLGFDKFAALEKDSEIYPTFGPEAAEAAREQVLRTLVDHLLVKNGDYRDLFVTRTTFMNAALGRVYKVPVDDPEGWAPYEFDAASPRAGLHTLVSFAALHAHAGRSSPTLRGKAVRELLLCQKIPEPPSDVDFTLFNDPNSPIATARQRLIAHNIAPACVGCHKLTDPIGLAMEHFDGAGQYRLSENDEPIDTSGELDGIPFSDAVGLGQAVRENPATASCLVTRVFSYGTGRVRTSEVSLWLAEMESAFAEAGYRLTSLLRTLATSDGFYAVAAETAAEAEEAP